MNLDINDQLDWLKAFAVLALWGAAVTANWYFCS